MLYKLSNLFLVLSHNTVLFAKVECLQKAKNIILFGHDCLGIYLNLLFASASSLEWSLIAVISLKTQFHWFYTVKCVLV